MLTSLALIFIVGLAMGAICSRLKLPRIIGMLVTGIVLGPYVLDFFGPINFVNFRRTEKNGINYYSVKSRFVTGY